jgi:periplasmic copper chaperone A
MATTNDVPGDRAYRPAKGLPDMIRSPLRRTAVVAATAGALLLVLAAPAAAHVTVDPNTATQGGFTTVTFRVPNETANADTTKVEVSFPADTPVAFVSLKPVAGWTAATEKTAVQTPITSGAGEVTEAVATITWTAQAGAAIKPGQFQEFDLTLGPLPRTDRMIFKALQTYSNGTVVRWIDDPATGAEPEHPAPVLTLAPAVAGAADRAAAADDGTGTRYGIAGIVLGLAALLLGLAALVLGLLAYRRAGRAAPARTGPQGAEEREPVEAGTAG